MDKFKRPTGSYISYMSNLVKSEGGINLAQGIPGFMPPKELLDILSNLAHEPIHQYAAGTGNIKLKEELVKHYSRYQSLTSNDILITNGGTEAITILFTYIMKMFPNSFTSLAFDPVYEVYSNLPNIYNKEFISFSYCEDGSIDFQLLKETIKKNNVKLVFINTPGNPLGRFWTKDEFDNIIKLSNDEDFYIILDAVYDELYFDEKPYIPNEIFSERIFYTNSFSKIFSVTGWRIGYLMAHSSHMIEIQKIHDYVGLCSPSILQEALARYIQSSIFGYNYVSDLRLKLKSTFNILKEELEKLGFYIPETKGGYFIWAKLPSKFVDGFDFSMKLFQETKLAVIPGIHFSKNYNNYIRINIARNKTEINEAIKCLNRFILEN